MDLVIERVVAPLTIALDTLVAESELEGWQFVRRLTEELTRGHNCFEKPGECLFTVRHGDRVVGVCGLNADPYVNNVSVGRVRRLYMLKDYRGRGISRLLVQAVMSAAREHFSQLRVRTENPAAGRLYERLGFQPVANVADCTHTLELSAA